MKLYNTLTQKIEEFKPFTENKIKMYVCGITPYDTTHIGHAFTYTNADILVRYFQFKGFEVEYTQNVTDIDDDILKRAKRDNLDWRALGDMWVDRFLEDMKWLGNQMPGHFVKATDSIDKMIEIIKVLQQKGYAYERDGTVYFEVSKFPKYGDLSHLSREEMIELSKERGADPTDPAKIASLDFILWQKAKAAEPSWDSPWGKGRPGWHIECSAMISQYLGDQIDIHGGGKDLEYPHHESEIAQSESFSGKIPFVKNWVHSAMVYYQGEKMSKSLGNLILVSELAKKYTSAEVRLALLSHHYRETWEFDESELEVARQKIDLYRSVSEKNNGLDSAEIEKQFMEYLEDDLNVPGALTYLEKMGKGQNIASSQLNQLLGILGLNILV